MAASAGQEAENQASSPTTYDSVEKEAPKDITETSSSTPEVKPARTIPNGGLQAWLQVVGAFFLYFNTWGECALLNSAGTITHTDWHKHRPPLQLRHLPGLLRDDPAKGLHRLRDLDHRLRAELPARLPRLRDGPHLRCRVLQVPAGRRVAAHRLRHPDAEHLLRVLAAPPRAGVLHRHRLRLPVHHVGRHPGVLV